MSDEYCIEETGGNPYMQGLFATAHTLCSGTNMGAVDAGFSAREGSSHQSRAGSRISRSRASTHLAPLPPPRPIALP